MQDLKIMDPMNIMYMYTLQQYTCAGLSITVIAAIAATREATLDVSTRGVSVAIVAACCTLVDICSITDQFN